VWGHVIERSGDGSRDRGGVPRDGNVGPTPSNITPVVDLSVTGYTPFFISEPELTRSNDNTPCSSISPYPADQGRP
jgi:hypothetical protein